MLLKFLRVKLHRVRITSVDLDYVGSLTVPQNILKISGLRPFEIIDVYNINNGKRFTTYVIEGDEGPEFCVNGAAARLVMPGDTVIIASFQYLEGEEDKQAFVKVLNFDSDNKIVNIEDKLIISQNPKKKV